jgi:[acyl-carrier-protein] S-malonyltransferase
MQDAVPVGSGAIAALLGLSEPQVREVCVEAAGGEVLEPANLNTPTQTVIAGSRAAVLRGIEVAKRRGAKRALLLPMSAPSHCALMAPACDQLRGYLSQVVVAPPKIPVIQNADVLAHREPEHIRDALIRQLCSPVRWVETIRYLADAGVTQVMECGPGKVLSGLTKRIVESGVQSFALADSAALAEARATGVH